MPGRATMRQNNTDNTVIKNDSTEDKKNTTLFKENKEQYKAPKKTTEKEITYVMPNNKTKKKVIVEKTYKNGVIKRSLKSVTKK